MGDGFGQTAQQYDQRIAKLSGMPFSPTYKQNILQNDDEILDSGMTARAAALVRPLGAKAEMSLAYRLQVARFIEGISASDPQPVVTALQDFYPGWTEIQLLQKLNADTTITLTAVMAKKASAISKQRGVQGVPTLIRHLKGEPEVIDVGRFYHSPDTITGLIY
ncbi:hypothetical protein GCM10007941_08190 [Amphritea balenae]|nr:hypothetical protein GCM10007941_08190 [Amphritea balenae]